MDPGLPPEEGHRPVMLAESMEWLDIVPETWYVDANLGGGGHTRAILEKGGKVLALDRDPASVGAVGSEMGERWGASLRLVRGNNADIAQWVGEAGIRPRGVLFDLGWSTLQGSDPTRGLSFTEDGPLDMRLDPSGAEESAQDLLDRLPEEELVHLLEEGDEPLAWPVARALATARREGRIPRSTLALAAFVSGVYYRKGFRRSKRHPATRTFMAFRIRVNREYENLARALAGSREVLSGHGGRLVVLTFHSGEDRIVKNSFREWVQQGAASFLFKKSLQPSPEESLRNPRARSARMRGVIFEG